MKTIAEITESCMKAYFFMLGYSYEYIGAHKIGDEVARDGAPIIAAMINAEIQREWMRIQEHGYNGG